jgi:hypothetical protein
LIPALRVIPSPTGEEPVNESTLGVLCSAIPSPISLPEPTITLSTPSGRPASSNSFASSRPPLIGVSPAGFNTTVLPAASAGATERFDSCSGKFQGLITATTPAGTR